MTLTLVLIALILTATAAAKGPSIQTRTAETIVQAWRCQDQLGQPRTHARSPWKPHSHAYRVWQLNLWTARKQACLAVLHERARQWNWRAWLPDKWRRIGMCETRLDWRWNSGTYQGAFGFYHGSWDAFRPAGYPTEAYLASPWQQYVVALRIYARYGLSGWGCRNA